MHILISLSKWLSNDLMYLIMKCHLRIYMVQTPHEEGPLPSKLGCATTLLPTPVTLETDIFHPTMTYYERKEWIMAFRGVWLFCYLSYIALQFFLFTLRGYVVSGVATGCSSLHQKEQWCYIPYIADFLHNGVPWGKCSLWSSSKLSVTSLELLPTGFSLNCDKRTVGLWLCIKVSELGLICTWSRPLLLEWTTLDDNYFNDLI
jgi:hypothetical protein